MSGFSKLFSSIVTSSLWVEPDPLLRVWVAMLATCTRHGFVSGSIPGFANLCCITADQMRECEAKLLAPDPESRTPADEGRRIKRVDGGWQILNYLKYRYMCSEEDRKEYKRKWIASHRKHVDKCRHVDNSVDTCDTIADAEADAEKDIVEKIYQAYPRKVGKPNAIRAIRKALVSVPPDELLQKTRAYAQSRAGDDPNFTPHPATWFNQQRFNDDPATWAKQQEKPKEKLKVV